jgi:DNA-binding MarR family transcriptional regulator
MKITKFLEQSPDYQLHLAGKRAAQSLNQELAAFEINMTQALILVALYFEPERRALFEDLADAFELTKGGLSQHLSQLEEKQFIRRPQSKEDKRSYQITLKAEAHDLCLKLIKIFDSHQRKLETTFGEADLKDFLSKLRQVLN